LALVANDSATGGMVFFQRLCVLNLQSFPKNQSKTARNRKSTQTACLSSWPSRSEYPRWSLSKLGAPLAEAGPSQCTLVSFPVCKRHARSPDRQTLCMEYGPSLTCTHTWLPHRCAARSQCCAYCCRAHRPSVPTAHAHSYAARAAGAAYPPATTPHARKCPGQRA